MTKRSVLIYCAEFALFGLQEISVFLKMTDLVLKCHFLVQSLCFSRSRSPEIFIGSGFLRNIGKDVFLVFEGQIAN